MSVVIEHGTRIELTRVVERWPHFRVEAGAQGTVTDLSNGNVTVRMDMHIDGAEPWDNEIVWEHGLVTAYDDLLDDAKVIGVLRTCRYCDHEADESTMREVPADYRGRRHACKNTKACDARDEEHERAAIRSANEAGQEDLGHS